MITKKDIEVSKLPQGFEIIPKPVQDFILDLVARLEQALAKIQEQAAEIEHLKAENAELKAEITDLKARLAKNSSNSSKPPSTDGYSRKPRTRSQRIKSDRKTGGQKGHKGSTLKPVANPDIVKNYDVTECTSCKHDLTGVAETSYTARQEVDIPPIKAVITEHRMVCKTCPSCGEESTAVGPEWLTQAIQFGPGIKALVSYIHYFQLIPLNRIVGFCKDVFGTTISQGTLVNIFRDLSLSLEGSYNEIIEGIINGAVTHFDESGIFINGVLNWLHVASNELQTAYYIHAKRGTDAINAMNILTQFHGFAIHDGWGPYNTYDNAIHALCNAHHSRELDGIYESYKQPWALEMRQHLQAINKTVNAFIDDGQFALPDEILKSNSDRYDQILLEAEEQVPTTNTTRQSKQRGRIKQHPSRNLLNRLIKYKKETLLFMYNFSVPFTNNQAERDIRMTKLKQKISGCFRSSDGAERFCRIRSVISSSLKRKISPLLVIEKAIRGTSESFASSP